MNMPRLSVGKQIGIQILSFLYHIDGEISVILILMGQRFGHYEIYC